MSEIRAGQVAKYMLLPSVLPRFQFLVGSGFGQIAFFIALLFKSVGLLPANHPYTLGPNIGRFGIFHVVAEAANRLEFRRDNIDQILIFSVIMLGIVILAMQLLVMMVGIFMPVAYAQSHPIFTDYRTAVSATAHANDISFILLDRVFGVEGVYNSCVSTAADCVGMGLSFLDASQNPVAADQAELIAYGATGDPTIPQLASSAASPYVPGGDYTLWSYRVGYVEDTGNPLPVPTTFPTAFHIALHRLLGLYSMALLVIAMIIFLYFVIAVVMETAQTGTPFGRRFNGVWAPIRFVVAIALLVPVMSTSSTANSSGLNAAQYIVLYAAKYGSIFATNGWHLFATSLYGEAGEPMAVDNVEGKGNTATLFGDRESLVAVPKVADIRHLIEFNMLAKTCFYMHMCETSLYNSNDNLNEQSYCPWSAGTDDFDDGTTPRQPNANYDPNCPAYPGDDSMNGGSVGTAAQIGRNCGVQPYLVRTDSDSGEDFLPFTHTPYEDNDSATVDSAMEFYNNGDVLIRYGIRDEEANSSHTGSVAPDCGEILLPTADLAEPGAKYLRLRFYTLLQEMWHVNENSGAYDDNVRDKTMDYFAKAYTYNQAILKNGETKADKISTSEEYEGILKHWAGRYDVATKNAQVVQINTGYYSMPDIALQRGWAGAGVWYNRLAEMNGTLVTTARHVGVVKKYPSVMEKVHEHRAQTEEAIAPLDRFNPNASKDTLKLSEYDKVLATTLYQVYKDWNKEKLRGSTTKEKSNNLFTDVVATLFGLSGLFDMRENTDIHPLAQLVAVGKSLVESSIVFLGVSLVGFIPVQGVSELGSIAISVATIGLTAGFVLYYVLPFLPFLYFFFAVGGWIKAIFEAMVGVPLWALAHLRIDGDGLPGEAGLAGYMLIFEIFLRPIMILFGLLASVTIFAAMVFVLNDIFDLVTDNLTGYDVENVSDTIVKQQSDGSITIGARTAADEAAGKTLLSMDTVRGPIDQFFFTVIYAIIVYMIGMSCFKLVDLIPNQILRWMGQSVSAFGEGQNDAAGQLTQYAAFGGMQVVGKLGGAVEGAQGAVKNAASAMQKQQGS